MKRLGFEEIVKRAKQVHGNKYEYPYQEDLTLRSKMKIICPIHGEFTQKADDHIRGHGCDKCGGTYKLSVEEFETRAAKIHKGKYIYCGDYKNSSTEVKIICPIHGEFSQLPSNHLLGYGCPKCAGKNLTRDEIINLARQVHGDKYDYSLIKEINSFDEKLPIICKKHGVFFQTMNKHISKRHGCQKCKMSHLEEKVKIYLDNNSIDYEYQKRFSWLGKQSLDFFIPSKNIAIECQGIQHFTAIDYFGGEESFVKQQKLDEKKRKLCEEKGIKLIYIMKTDEEIVI